MLLAAQHQHHLMFRVPGIGVAARKPRISKCDEHEAPIERDEVMYIAQIHLAILDALVKSPGRSECGNNLGGLGSQLQRHPSVHVHAFFDEGEPD